MAESTVIVALRGRRTEMERQITYLEGKIAELRANLVHVSAVLHLYEGDAGSANPAPYRIQLSKAVAPGEYLSLALAALTERGVAMTTSELALFVMARKGWNPNDLVLRRSLVRRISDALAKAHRRGKVGSSGTVKGVRVWVLP